MLGTRHTREEISMRGPRNGIGSAPLALIVFVALTAGCQPADDRPGLEPADRMYETPYAIASALARMS